MSIAQAFLLMTVSATSAIGVANQSSEEPRMEAQAEASAGTATANDPINTQATLKFDGYQAELRKARNDYQRSLAAHRHTMEQAAAEQQRYEAAVRASEEKQTAWSRKYGAKTSMAETPKQASSPPRPRTTGAASSCRMERVVESSIPQRVCGE